MPDGARAERVLGSQPRSPLCAIVAINGRNRLAIAFRAVPGGYVAGGGEGFRSTVEAGRQLI
jgi:hypothetical protein